MGIFVHSFHQYTFDKQYFEFGRIHKSIAMQCWVFFFGFLALPILAESTFWKPCANSPMHGSIRKQQKAKVDHVEVDGCSGVLCQIKRGSKVNVKISFTPNTEIPKVYSYIRAKITALTIDITLWGSNNLFSTNVITCVYM